MLSLVQRYRSTPPTRCDANRSLRRVVALAPSLGARISPRACCSCVMRWRTWNFPRPSIKLRETTKRLIRTAACSTLPEDEQSKSWRAERVTRQPRRTAATQADWSPHPGRTPRVLRPTKRSRVLGAPTPRPARPACRRPQTDSGGSADGSGDPPPAPPWRSIVAAYGVACVGAGRRGVDLRPNASVDELRCPRSPVQSRGIPPYAQAAGDTRLPRSAAFRLTAAGRQSACMAR